MLRIYPEAQLAYFNGKGSYNFDLNKLEKISHLTCKLVAIELINDFSLFQGRFRRISDIVIQFIIEHICLLLERMMMM